MYSYIQIVARKTRTQIIPVLPEPAHYVLVHWYILLVLQDDLVVQYEYIKEFALY